MTFMTLFFSSSVAMQPRSGAVPPLEISGICDLHGVKKVGLCCCDVVCLQVK